MSKPGITLCEDCVYHDASIQSGVVELDTTGLCRRRSPKSLNIYNGAAQWPFTELTDGCGDGWSEPGASK